MQTCLLGLFTKDALRMQGLFERSSPPGSCRPKQHQYLMGKCGQLGLLSLLVSCVAGDGCLQPVGVVLSWLCCNTRDGVAVVGMDKQLLVGVLLAGPPSWCWWLLGSGIATS